MVREGYSQMPDCRVRTRTRGLMTSCRQLSGRFQFRSSLSGSTTGTVSSSKNSTGNWGRGRVSAGEEVQQSSPVLWCSVAGPVPSLQACYPHLCLHPLSAKIRGMFTALHLCNVGTDPGLPAC